MNPFPVGLTLSAETIKNFIFWKVSEFIEKDLGNILLDLNSKCFFRIKTVHS